MCDLPENLQIKREPSPPSTPEDKSSPHNIKAKLNLHVKRRLQDFSQANTALEETSYNNKTPPDIKQEPQKLETTRQKRPYHKRTDKHKPHTPSLEASATTNVATSAGPRKYKHKIKQIVANNDNQELTASSNAALEEPLAVGSSNTTITAGALSAGDEDEAGHDADLKAVREKEKCPDVLAMVLSMKKRALMQDPEVQKFLKDVMEVIKS
ncbi:uncharacterized protein LOC119602953 [Lucilia sericata]|uniref:uncharacterized protein LOC119602953 n=1 Tax=Lucilia sericata TaxID=13632 RepID=UPI0018A83276|nr:uncharacterized protein LOC119602953 [Lucilia sericata]